MLKTIELDSNPAFMPWLVVKKEEQRNQENASRYTSKQRSNAQTLVDLLDYAYAAKGFHVNYRKTFIAIKVDHPIVKDRKQVKILEELFDVRGYTKAVTAQGFIIRIPNV